MESITEEDLKLAAQGQPQAFERLYRATAGFVYSVALRVTGSRQDAEDVTQEVFVRVYRALSSFRGESGFRTWIYRITVNAALEDFLKRRKL